jgi:transposase InsO family protein
MEIGSVGDRHDNALAETTTGSTKRRSVTGADRGEASKPPSSRYWVDGFNNRQLLEPIGNTPPAEARERGDATLSEREWRRDLDQTTSGESGRFTPRGVRRLQR